MIRPITSFATFIRREAHGHRTEEDAVLRGCRQGNRRRRRHPHRRPGAGEGRVRQIPRREASRDPGACRGRRRQATIRPTASSSTSRAAMSKPPTACGRETRSPSNRESSDALRALLLAGHPGARRVRAPRARGGRRALRRCRARARAGPRRQGADGDTRGAGAPHTPFAPPFLRDGEIVVSHVANILQYLGPKLGLAPRRGRPPLRPRPAAHDHGFRGRGSRHASPDRDRPLLRGPEEGGEGARRGVPQRSRAEISRLFRARAARQSGRSSACVGDSSPPSICRCFRSGRACAYAFPHAFADAEALYPALAALAESVAARPNVAAYLASDRRIPFNEFGDLPPLSRARPGPAEGEKAEAVIRSDGVSA